MKETRCAIYLRISQDKAGEELAVDRQREDALRLIKKRGWIFTEEYIDNSISASKKNVVRPSYERMVADYAAGKFQAMICYDLDRLTRQPRQLEDWIDAAEERGLILLTLNGEADLSTDGGRLFARIKASVARGEVERASARQKRANDQKAGMGKPTSSTRPFGYQADLMTIEPEEAGLLLNAAATILEGGSLMSIARDWESKGVISSRKRKMEQGQPYSREAIRYMLVNPRYAGRQIHRGKDIGEGLWEPIFDLETHIALKQRLDDSKRKLRTMSRGQRPENLLTGIATCGHCGLTIRAGSKSRRIRKADSGRRPNVPTYYCGACKVHIDRSQADTQAVTRVLARLSQPDYLEGLVAAQGVSAGVIQLSLDALTEREGELGTAFAMGQISMAVMQAGMTSIEEQRDTFLGQLDTSGHTNVFDGLDLGSPEVIAQFEGLSLERKRGLIAAASSSITLWRQRDDPRRIVVKLHGE